MSIQQPPRPPVSVHLTQDEAEDIIDILTRDLQGHHNRMESYILGDDVAVNLKSAKDAASAASRVRRLRGHFHRAMGDTTS